MTGTPREVLTQLECEAFLVAESRGYYIPEKIACVRASHAALLARVGELEEALDEIAYHAREALRAGSPREEEGEGDGARRRTPEAAASGAAPSSSDRASLDGAKRLPISEFRELGWVQEINRVLLHPSGLALEVVVDEDGSERLGGVWDYRDDSEGVYFGSLDAEATNRALALQNDRASRASARRAALGFVIEPLPPTVDA